MNAAAETELQKFKEDELLQLVRETVEQLNILGDRLEHYAEARKPREGESDVGRIVDGGQ